MLTSLSIRNVVLIDRLDLEFVGGLAVLTGETGAGKSILLDALGLALGDRADAGLVSDDSATVTASFDLEDGHPALALLHHNDIEPPEPGDPLILKRTLTADGRSRARINDQTASVGLLREIGRTLVEIESHYATQGLLDPSNHRAALDRFAGIEDRAASVAERWRDLAEARRALADVRAEMEKARTEEDYIRHMAAELADLAPEMGEEARLSERRAVLSNADKLAEAVQDAQTALSDPEAIDARLGRAERGLLRAADRAGGTFDEALAAIARAGAEAAEALRELDALADRLVANPEELQRIETRLFALREAARKHRTDVEGLPALAERYEQMLGGLDGADERIAEVQQRVDAARSAFVSAAEALGSARAKAARRFDKAIMAELPPLRLEKATFQTRIDRLDEADWGPGGMESVTFEIATNAGQSPGPIRKIASAGELSRLMLALKVALATGDSTATLVFDEVDSGIGGATAAAVGERLARLSQSVQVLVITHSPQVAARGDGHWRVEKSEDKGRTRTAVTALDPSDRQEEIARMLAGAKITKEARAAAASLMAGETA